MPETIGKYQILERIGRGGMGAVFKARDPVLDRLVALKVISSEGDATEELKARFYREAQAGAKLNHPNIIVVHDLGENEGRLFIVMEFLDGVELKHLIAERRSLSLEEKLSLMIQICRGLHYAHQNGVIHRDVKPGNIFVLRNGQVKILDFGIARIATTDPGLTRTGLIMGTLRYMSPEQARGRVDHRSDMFSAGAVFYELLAYRAAFDSEDPMETLEQLRTENPPALTEVEPTIPPDLAAVVERALRKDPAQRFVDMGEMAAKLEDVRRRLAEEAERLPARVRAQLEQVRALEARLARRLGQPPDDETLPAVVDGAGTAELRARERELVARIAGLEARLEAPRPPEPRATAGVAGPPRAVSPPAPRVTPALETPVQPPAPAPSRGRRAALSAAAGLIVLASVGAGAYFLRPSSPPAPPASVTAPGPPPPAAPVVPAPTTPVPAPPSAAARPPAEEVPRHVLETGRLQERAAAARRAAEVADAPKHAAPAWAQAIGAERAADEAVTRRDFDRAQAAWRDAEKAYREAESAASKKVAAASATESERVAALKRELQAAEQVAATAATARREAEQAGASRHAARLVASAGDKLKEAQTALERQDYGLAQRRFRDAQEEYQRATQEAKKAAAAEVAAAAALRQDIDRARSSAAAARQQALAIGADQMAKDLVEGARAKEAEAASLESQQNLTAATQAFQDASQRYGEAWRRTQVAREAKAEADHARARMLAEKERARAEATEFRTALAEEVRGDQTYERHAYKEAAGHYRTALRLFSRAAGGAGPGPRGGPGDPRAEIRGVIESYKQAIEGRDVALFQKVRPSLKEADVRRSFEQSESHKVDLTIRSIDVSGDEAEVRGRRADEVISKDGRKLSTEQSVVFKLKRTPAGWVIDAVN